MAGSRHHPARRYHPARNVMSTDPHRLNELINLFWKTIETRAEDQPDVLIIGALRVVADTLEAYHWLDEEGEDKRL